MIFLLAILALAFLLLRAVRNRSIEREEADVNGVPEARRDEDGSLSREHAALRKHAELVEADLSLKENQLQEQQQRTATLDGILINTDKKVKELQEQLRLKEVTRLKLQQELSRSRHTAASLSRVRAQHAPPATPGSGKSHTQLLICHSCLTLEQRICELQEKLEDKREAAEAAELALQSENDGLKSQVEHLSANVASLEANLRTTTQDLESSHQQTRQSETKVCELSTQLSILSAQLAVAAPRAEQLDSCVQQLEQSQSQAAQLGTLVDSLEAQLAASSAQVSALRQSQSDAAYLHAASEAQLHQAQSDVAELRERVDSLDAQLAASKVQLSTLRQSQSDAAELRDASEAQLRQALSDVAELNELLASLNAQLAASKAQLHQAQSDVTDLRELGDSLNAQLAASEAQLSSMRLSQSDATELPELVDSLKAQLAASEAQLSALRLSQSDTTEMHAHVDRLTAQLATKEDALHVDALRQTQKELAQGVLVDDLRAQLTASLDAHQAASKAELGTLRQSQEGLQGQLSTPRVSQPDVDDFQAQISSLSARLADMSVTVSSLEDELACSQERGAELSLQFETAQLQLETAQQELQTAQQQLDTAQEECVTAQQECATAQQECATAQQERATAQQQLDTAQKECVTAQQECATAQQERATAQQQLDTAQEECVKAQQECATARQERATAQQQLNTAQVECITAQQEYVTAQQERATAQQSLDKCSSEVEVAKAESAALEAEVAQAKSTIGELQNERCVVQQGSHDVQVAAQRVEELKNEVSELKLEVSELEELKRKVSELTLEISEGEELKREVSELKLKVSEVEELKRVVSELQTGKVQKAQEGADEEDLTVLRERCQELEQIQSDRDQLLSQTEDQASELQSVRTALAQAYDQVTVAENALDLMRAQLDYLGQQSDEVVSVMEQNSSTISEVHGQVQRFQAGANEGCIGVEGGLSEVERLLHALLERNDSINLDASKYQAQAQKARAELKDVSSERLGLQKVRDSLKAKVDSLESSMADLAGQSQDARDQLAASQEEVSSLRIEVAVQCGLEDLNSRLQDKVASLEQELEQIRRHAPGAELAALQEISTGGFADVADQGVSAGRPSEGPSAEESELTAAISILEALHAEPEGSTKRTGLPGGPELLLASTACSTGTVSEVGTLRAENVALQLEVWDLTRLVEATQPTMEASNVVEQHYLKEISRLHRAYDRCCAEVQRLTGAPPQCMTPSRESSCGPSPSHSMGVVESLGQTGSYSKHLHGHFSVSNNPIGLFSSSRSGFFQGMSPDGGSAIESGLTPEDSYDPTVDAVDSGSMLDRLVSVADKVATPLCFSPSSPATHARSPTLSPQDLSPTRASATATPQGISPIHSVPSATPNSVATTPHTGRSPTLSVATTTPHSVASTSPESMSPTQSNHGTSFQMLPLPPSTSTPSAAETPK